VKEMTIKFKLEEEFKETEVGEIPKDWDLESLEWATESLESGNRPKGGSLKHDPKGVLSIGGENITWQGDLVLNECLRFEKDFYEFLNKGKIEKDDILLVKDGATIGKLVFIREIPEDKAMVNEHVFLIKTNKEKYNPRFLFYYLFSEAGQMLIESAIGGSAQGGITKGILDIVKILKFNPCEQSRIAIVLSWFDDLIDNKKRQNEILEKTAMAIFKSWFIDFEPFKKEAFVDSELGKIPKGWSVKSIDKLAEIRNGLSYSGKEKFEEPVKGSFVFITLNNAIEGGGFKPVYAWIKSDRIRKHHFLEEGDLIIPNTEQTKDERLLGSPGIVFFPENYKGGGGVYSHHITKISPYDQKLKLFLYLLLRFTREDSASFATGTGVLGMDIKNFKRNKLVITPPKPILEKFHSIVEFSFEKIITNQKQIMVLRKALDTLLPLLVFGKLRVEEI